MAVKLADKQWFDVFKQELTSLEVNPLGIDLLQKTDQPTIEFANKEFWNCKIAIAQIYAQTYCFWFDLPWVSCAIAAPLFCSGGEIELQTKIQCSKKLAAQCKSTFQEGHARDRILSD